jgi:hypothetical protein
MKDAYKAVNVQPKDDDSEDGESGDDGEAVLGGADQKTGDGPGTAARAPPENMHSAVRHALLEAREAELQSHATDILKADIKGCAAGIKNIEDKLNPAKKVNKWKDKSAMANLNVLIGKLKEQGQDLPCLQALHDAAKHNSEFTPAELKLMVAQAWPEVTRLRVERAAKIEGTKLLDAMQAYSAGDTEDKEFSEITNDVTSAHERLGDEAKVLNAACQLGCLTTMVAHKHTTTEANPLGVQPDGVAIEMKDAQVAPASLLQNARIMVQEHKDFMQEAAANSSGGYKQLNAAIAKLEKINDNPEEDLRPDQVDALVLLVKELSAPCIYLHASQQAVTAPVLEKLLVAAQRSATGESSAYYLSAVIEEIRPQVERIKQKEEECHQVCDSLNALSKIIESGDNDSAKEQAISNLLDKDQGKITKVLHGHKARYIGWSHEAPMTSSFRQPVSKSAELACLAAIVSTCEGVCARPGEDAMTHANTEIKKLYRPTPLKKGDAEKFARCLVAMERFGHMDEGTSTEELKQKIEEGREPLARFRDDMRMNVTGLSTAFDLCDKIINRTEAEEDESYFSNDPKLVEKFKNAVFDAWANVTTLQAERHANKLAKSAMQRLEALKTDNMTFDTFQADVMNDRRALNSLLEEDKDLHNEQLLLKSLGELQSINDPDAINVATRETKSQLENIETVQRHTEALKAIAEAFKRFMNPELKTEAVKDLKKYISEYAEIVVQLQALDADGGPLRQALITAAMMIDGTAEDVEVLQVAQQVIGPAVLQHCSAPKSSDLNMLMTTIKEIVDQQSGSVTVKDQVGAQTRATNGRNKVKEEMDSHRKRLTFRSRLAFKKRAEENIELRAAEKTGAEWDGFNVEDVSLKSATADNRTPCQKAFDEFDKNKDSIVTINEVIEYLLAITPDERPEGLKDINPFQKAKMKKRLEKMDTDKDGTLSFEEFSTWWESNAAGKPTA